MNEEKKLLLSEQGKRLKESRESLGLTQEEFGKPWKMGWSKIKDRETGIVKISDMEAMAFQDRYRISAEWLRTGQGEMRSAAIPPVVANPSDHVTLRDILDLKQEIIKLHEMVNGLGLEIGEIRSNMDEVGRSGDIHRLGVIGGKGK